MLVRWSSPQPQEPTVGETWAAYARVYDDDGLPLTPDSIAIECPSRGISGLTEELDTGFYRLYGEPQVAGEYDIVATVEYDDKVDIQTWQLIAVDETGTLPGVDDVLAYLGDTSWDGTTIAEVIEVERLAQAHACRVPATYPADLAEALKRRVARNLEIRSVRVGSVTTFDGGVTASRVTGSDPEVRRLEAYYRKRVVA